MDIGPPKRRALLLRLLLENGRAVAVERLCDDLWDGSPPPSALSSLHAHISRLRMVLEPDRARQEQAMVLRSVPTGYALRVPLEELDSAQFERAVERAHTLAGGSRIGEARKEIERAMSLWRGAPLADASQYRFAEREAVRLEELKLSAEELRTTLLFQEGQVAQAISGAERLVERDPLREASWAMLMRALYVAGRHAEALQRYETVRALLSRDRGLDPGPTLRETRLAILRHDTVVLQPPALPFSGSASVSTTIPRQVHVREPLLGREEEVDRLSGMLQAAAGGRTSWAVVSGEPGVGKTRIAEELARQAAEAGFGALWVQCTEEGHLALPDGPYDRLARELRQRASDRSSDTADTPTLCVLEDVHRAPAEMRGLLSSYARILRGAHLAVLCTVADDPGTDVEQLLADLAGCGADQIRLAPLTEAAVKRIVEEAEGYTVPRSTATELHELSGGNPFLLTELLKLPAPLRARVSDQVPPAVQSVVRVRLARLTPDARTIIDSAAVLGARPDMNLVARLTGMPVDTVLQLADQAVVGNLLCWSEATQNEPGGYRFPAGVLLRGVLAQLSPARRQTLHAEAARALVTAATRHTEDIAAHVAAAGPALPRNERMHVALRREHDDGLNTVALAP
ncbi:AAA family ATPase [Streptomyces sp. JH14]|uniref:BTAD domain-containing putative transcriptional regulator n=1 Tax=Streptomyces sp. JH14 TaxID=2793630 RepID=UPI0023F62540|nr:BREX system ATP-binding domain-containing protein [Streptomyces sp. JH14]MDF6045550.1 AAA family ATPase [Streptomyces sp. JH14]